MKVNVMILGGTAEARALAEALDALGHVAVTSSLAGRVSTPRLPVGQVRIGGFGGAEGLADALRTGEFTHLVDATHPFAVSMTAHAAQAARLTGLPTVRLARPGWREHPDAEAWQWVRSYDEARGTVDDGGFSRPFLTSGRQTLGHFATWNERQTPRKDVLVRVVEPLDGTPPANWTAVLDRGPFDVETEESLMRSHGVDVIVTKDSGGQYTAAKLAAAKALGAAVVVVERPPTPHDLVECGDVAAVITALGLD